MSETSSSLISDLEDQIEALSERRSGVVKAVLLSRLAFWGGLGLLGLVFAGFVLSNRTEIGIAAFSAAVGGIVFGGSSKSTSQQLSDEIARLEIARSQAIDALDLEFVRASALGSNLLH